MEPSRISIVLDSDDRTSTGIVEEERFLLLMTASRRLVQRFSPNGTYPIELIAIRTKDAKGYGRSYEIRIVLRRPGQVRDPDKTECSFSFCPDNPSMMSSYCPDDTFLVDKFIALGVRHIQKTVENISQDHALISERWTFIKDLAQ